MQSVLEWFLGLYALFRVQIEWYWWRAEPLLTLMELSSVLIESLSASVELLSMLIELLSMSVELLSMLFEL